MKLPEIRINYSWQLASGPSKILEQEYGKGHQKYTDEAYHQWAQEYREAWAKNEKPILQAMQDVFGLEFYQPVIEVSLAPWFREQSDPLILNFRSESDQFVDLLTHELLHVLLSDNTTYSIKSSPREIDLTARWAKLFGDREFDELVHIPVHAGAKYIYIDMLQERARLERDIDDVKSNPPYKAAWEYVEQHDYKQIIQQIIDDFGSIIVP